MIRIFSLLLFVFSINFYTEVSGQAEQKDYKYDFKTVPNDPFNVLQYQLDNGLKIYLSVNKDEPRVSTNIAVRTGSKNDPSEVTGLAHYLEHMLFKGTSKMASLDWEKEKVLLKQISDLYEKHRNTTDAEERKEIYAEIDRLSGEAAAFVATNEYDQMVTELGARGTNAYTSWERTVYINDIPSNELGKWMALESERFKELTLRLFHTELEAVFEEFNRTQDSDGRQVFYKMYETLFPNHHYGQQSTIGLGEHLKNPSMEKIHQYFDKYYVPNNMAVILVGDLDPDRTVDMLKKHFGEWEKGPQPEQYSFRGEKAILNPIEKEVIGAEAAYVNLAYRTGGIDSKDAMLADLTTSILNNGEAGLMDQNLNNAQKVIRSYAYVNTLKDYSVVQLGATPREGQTLEEAKDLLLGQVKILKKGEFDESLIPSIVKNAKKQQQTQAENNSWTAYAIINAFTMEKPWSYFADYYDEMAKISKQELAEWANKNLKNNYVVVYKREGERTPLRLEKPAITPITVNRGKNSAFREEWAKIPSERMTPEFMDYDKAIDKAVVFDNLQLHYIKNVTNDLFEMHYILDMGSRHDKELALAIEYLPYLGTSKYSVDEIKRKFYDLALSYNVYAGSDRVYVSLYGLQESMNEGVALFEELLGNVKADAESYGKFVDGIIKERADAKLSKSQILYGGMMNYATYGADNPFTDKLSEEKLRAMDPQSLAAKIRGLKGYKHKVFYYGPSEKQKVVDLLREKHPIPIELQDYPERKEYSYQNFDKDIVYYVDYDQVQTELMMLSKGEKFDQENMAAANVFNQYFGAGLSSIVFQEIRESKALAYSAYSFFTSPRRADEPHFVRAYVGSQADKLGQAVDAMQELMSEMPREEAQFQQSKTGALKQMETNRTTKDQAFWEWQNAKDRGLSKNPAPENYAAIQKMSVEDLNEFFNEHIKGNNYTFLVIGKRSVVDMEALKKLGTVRELKLEEIFGY